MYQICRICTATLRSRDLSPRACSCMADNNNTETEVCRVTQ